MKRKDKWDSCLYIPEPPVSVSLYIIVLLAMICFYPTLYGEFVFDDSEAVVNNEDVKLSTPLSQVFLNDFWGTRITHNASHKSYRPLAVLTYRLNVIVAGGELHATHFRIVNLVLYMVVCCLSLFVFKAVCGAVASDRVALFASILFTAHPLHSEVVAPAVGRADLLCALFMLSAFLVYCRALDHSCNLLFSLTLSVLTVFLAALAMFSKEQGITILAVCSTHDMLLELQPKKRLAGKSCCLRFLCSQAVLFLAAVGLLVVRFTIMGGTTPVFHKVDNPASFMTSTPWRLVNYLYIYALNTWLLLCPEWLCFDWAMGCIPLIYSAQDVRFLIVLLFLFLFGDVVYKCSKDVTGETRREAMALVFMVVPFLPASNIFFRVGFVIAERNLLVPSLGYCLFVTLGLRKLTEWKVWKLMGPVMMILLIMMFCTRSQLRVRQWSSERNLYQSALDVCPLNAKVHYNLAKTSSHHIEAMKHYRQALWLNPEYDQAMNNLANILKDIGEHIEAEKLLRKALILRPDFAAAWMNLGIILTQQKKFKDAERCYWNAIKYRRNYPDCFYNLGNLWFNITLAPIVPWIREALQYQLHVERTLCTRWLPSLDEENLHKEYYLEQKLHDKAYEIWQKATTLNPKHQQAWNNLIIMLDSIGKHKEASEVGQEALTHLPDSAAIFFNTANALGKIQNFEEAESHYAAALYLSPHNPLYHINLGVLYHHWKKYDLAKEFYEKALRLDPNLKSAKLNLRLLENI